MLVGGAATSRGTAASHGWCRSLAWVGGATQSNRPLLLRVEPPPPTPPHHQSKVAALLSGAIWRPTLATWRPSSLDGCSGEDLGCSTHSKGEADCWAIPSYLAPHSGSTTLSTRGADEAGHDEDEDGEHREGARLVEGQ